MPTNASAPNPEFFHLTVEGQAAETVQITAHEGRVEAILDVKLDRDQMGPDVAWEWSQEIIERVFNLATESIVFAIYRKGRLIFLMAVGRRTGWQPYCIMDPDEAQAREMKEWESRN
jgi:hypothetical protein